MEPKNLNMQFLERGFGGNATNFFRAKTRLKLNATTTDDDYVSLEALLELPLFFSSFRMASNSSRKKGLV